MKEALLILSVISASGGVVVGLAYIWVTRLPDWMSDCL